METTKENSEFISNLDKNDKNGNNTTYYGVYTPNDHYDPAINVFQDKIEALKLAKKNKKSRFKPFQFYHEALEFARNGSEYPNNNVNIDGLFYVQTNHEQTQQSVGEKASPFKGPKPQELVELRKAIENGNEDFVKETIWQNPRYLVSSGDTPSILQEGPRYNALHVCAKANNARLTELILNTVSDVEFVKLLYGDDNEENALRRTKILLDLYLNTPNKGLNETPLHFASKYGAYEVVEVLVSFPECDRTLKNKYQKTAEEVICERAETNSSPIKKKIQVLLQQNYYVPVLRSEGNSLPPIIGEPFSPTQPLVLPSNPLSPRLEIHAYAGPMDKSEAQRFRRVWKTPPRSAGFGSPNVRRFIRDEDSPPSDVSSALRFRDPDKGLERIGSNLAGKYEVGWKEYWPFLNGFVDIVSEEGLNLLEKHLIAATKLYDKQSVVNSPVSVLSQSRSEIISPMSSLCAAFQNCHLNDSNKTSTPVQTTDKKELKPVSYIDKACQVFSNRISNDVLHILCKEYNNIAPVLEIEMKQLELLVASYMEDARFAGINFQKVHSRLGALVGNKLCHNIKDDSRQFLCSKLEYLLECVTKSLDCFSSDDEAIHFRDQNEMKKPTSHKRQLICLVEFILDSMRSKFVSVLNLDNEEECVADWCKAEECHCVYRVRKWKKNSLSRSGSAKNKSHFKSEVLPIKLCFDDDEKVIHRNNINNSLNGLTPHEDESSSSDDEHFYTPPSSPTFQSESESDNEFNDTQLPELEIFIYGTRPTKTDYDVFNALRYSNCVLSETTHPYVYRWRHNVGLYSETERERWPSPHHLKVKQREPNTPDPSMNGSINSEPLQCSTPSKSWIRITGANSPRAAFKNLKLNF